MGYGYYNVATSCAYKTSTFGTADTATLSNMNAQSVYKARKLNSMLDPLNKRRECLDSEDHPTSLPIILGLDCTGSMGHAATATLAKMDETMEELYKTNKDVEFCVMGVGDFYCDEAPLQVSQFEADIRILEQSAALWLEFGGGGNAYESYTGPWYYGTYRCDCDCWKRGQKGILITCGDEGLNPYINSDRLREIIGGEIEGPTETEELYKEASKKWDIYHIAITDNSSYRRYKNKIEETWRPLLGDHLIIAESTRLPQVIAAIVNGANLDMESTVSVNEDGISW